MQELFLSLLFRLAAAVYFVFFPLDYAVELFSRS